MVSTCPCVLKVLLGNVIKAGNPLATCHVHRSRWRCPCFPAASPCFVLICVLEAHIERNTWHTSSVFPLRPPASVFCPSRLPFLQFSFSILSYHVCYSYNSCISCLRTCSFFKVFFFGRVTEIKKMYVHECLPASVSMCPIHAVPKEAKRGRQIPWTWSYRWGRNWGLVEEQQVLSTTESSFEPHKICSLVSSIKWIVYTWLSKFLSCHWAWMVLGLEEAFSCSFSLDLPLLF